MNVIRTHSAPRRCSTPPGDSCQPATHLLSLGAFAELGLFTCGIYLLAEARLKPLEADQVSILGAGVLLALASVLLIYMVRPQIKDALSRPAARGSWQDSEEPTSQPDRDSSAEAGRETARDLLDQQDLPGPL